VRACGVASAMDWGLVEVVVGADGVTLEPAQPLREGRAGDASAWVNVPGARPVPVEGQRGRVLAWLEDEQKYVVQTLDGNKVGVASEHLQEFRPPSGDQGGFDVVWPGDECILYDDFGQEVCETLARRGFCVVHVFSSLKARETAREAVEKLVDWKRLAPEVEAAYLGRNAKDKVCWMTDEGTDAAEADGLLATDRVLTELCFSLFPFTGHHLGFEAYSRSLSLVRQPFKDSKEEDHIMRSQKPLKNVDVFGGEDESAPHVSFIQLRKLCILYFVGGNGGTLTLHPKKDVAGAAVDISIPCEQSRMVIFRHDALSYTYSSSVDAFAVQAWMLAMPCVNVVTGVDPEKDIVELDRPCPVYGQTGQTVGVMSIQTCNPGCSYSWDDYLMMFSSGTDCGIKVPSARWHHDEYYDPNGQGATYYSNHGGFIAGNRIFEFDNDFFGISVEEAKRMDPCMRLSTETGFECLTSAGWTEKTLNSSKVGVYIGWSGSDFTSNAFFGSDPRLPLELQTNPWSADSRSGVHAWSQASRLSYLYHLRGPVHNNDTACSSSLVATAVAHYALRPREPTQEGFCTRSDLYWALVLGVNGLLGPGSWIGLCGPHMVSHEGRCFTFDASADGFARGEGVSGITLKSSEEIEEPTDRYAMLCGSCTNQDGRSASMTAPHGPSQQECIVASLREANITATDIRVAELHGTGTALGDPIEVGALRGVMRKRDDPIYKTSAKCNMEHTEAAAGMNGLIKCLSMTVLSAVPPNIHLRLLNAHMDTNAYPVLFPDEYSDFCINSGYAGVSSFGFGGANARADVWARCMKGPRRTGGNLQIDKLALLHAKKQDLLEHLTAIQDPDIDDTLKERMHVDVQKDEVDMNIEAIDAEGRLGAAGVRARRPRRLPAFEYFEELPEEEEVPTGLSAADKHAELTAKYFMMYKDK